MPMHRFLSHVLSFASLMAQPSGELGLDAMRQKATQRHEAHIKEGYNLTYGWSLGGQSKKGIMRLPLLVPEAQIEHQLSFWLEAQGGEVSVQLLGEGGKVLVSWSGRQCDMVLSRRFATGKYILEIDSSRVVAGRAEFGVKGPLAQSCDLDQSRCQECPPSPPKTFRWPYLLFVPKTIKHATILVVPNNTGFAVENLDLIRANGVCEVQRSSALAERLGCPLLVPLFPRPAMASKEENLYLHALSRASLLTQVEPWKRADLQLLGMIQDARSRLQTKGLKVSSKVILWGFSASGSFVNRFTILHPEHVLAVACGSPGGWPMVPVADLEGERLGYPLGVSDLEALTGRPIQVGPLRRVRWFFFLGDQDANDAVPWRDSFSKLDEDLINRRFGTTLVARWKQAERLYLNQGLLARFVVYPGVPHEVTPEMDADIARFFEGCLGAASATSLD